MGDEDEDRHVPRQPITEMSPQDARAVRVGFEDMLSVRRANPEMDIKTLGCVLLERHKKLFYMFPLTCKRVIDRSLTDRDVEIHIFSVCRAQEAQTSTRPAIVFANWRDYARGYALSDPAHFERALATSAMDADLFHQVRMAHLEVLQDTLRDDPDEFAAAEARATTAQQRAPFIAARVIANAQ